MDCCCWGGIVKSVSRDDSFFFFFASHFAFQAHISADRPVDAEIWGDLEAEAKRLLGRGCNCHVSGDLIDRDG